jgi:hypothetical protein
MDPFEEVTREIHTELERICARSITYGKDAKDREKIKAPPFVIWEEQGGADEEPNQTMSDTLLIDVSRVRVTVGGVDAEYARKLAWNLKQAGRTKWGRDLQWLDRSPPNDAKEGGYLACAVIFVLNARLSLRVRKTPWKLPNGQEPPAAYVQRQVVDHSFTATVSGDPPPDGWPE